METVSTINENEIKKELLKSKVNAKFSHYISGNIYYTIEMYNETYQFPISTVDKLSLGEAVPNGLYTEDGNSYLSHVENLFTLKDGVEILDIDKKEDFEEFIFTKLSSDLGTTTFNNEIKGSELNRWIIKSIKNNEFIKIS